MIPIQWHSKLIKIGYELTKKNYRKYYKQLGDRGLCFLIESPGSSFGNRNMHLSWKHFNDKLTRKNIELEIKLLIEKGIRISIRMPRCENCDSDFRVYDMYCSKECKIEHYKKYGTHCVICNELHLSDNKVCSESCQSLFCESDEDHICKACFCPIYEDLVGSKKDITKHHINYFPEEIVPVHRSCHDDIHWYWEHPHLSPIYGESDKFYAKKPLKPSPDKSPSKKPTFKKYKFKKYSQRWYRRFKEIGIGSSHKICDQRRNHKV